MTILIFIIILLILIISHEAANFFMAFIIFSVVSVLGTPRGLSLEEALLYPDARIAIVDVVVGSPAQLVGIQAGDKIKSIAGSIPKNLEDVQGFIRENRGKDIDIQLERNGDIILKNITPRLDSPNGEGPLGIALSWVRIEKSAWYKSPWEGVKITYNIFVGT